MFQLICRPASLSEDMKVAALITDEHEWKEDLINTEFCPEDAACILGIDLQGGVGKDELVWHFERNGKFLVRSAYWVACRIRNGASSSQHCRSGNFIWRSKVPHPPKGGSTCLALCCECVANWG
ncbi:UNVERIFIED_CONTAM: hypothetical protein Sradi_0729800 [Sesamum radiatum]|uniref:Uncharacterized protein n=1 Tax=Sesamum radiatum TaxID=300843 RepID=A0AAW2VP11_SESRA